MSCCEKLTALAKMSNKYGADANYVLAGGEIHLSRTLIIFG